MKFNKKVLSIFFIALLAIVLVACGGTTTTQAPTTVEPTTQGPTTQAPTTVAPTTDAPIDLLALIEQLRNEYGDTLNDDDFIATENLNLITSFMGVTIAWQSSNTTYLENDGTIHRPSYALGDQTVILTATLSYGDNSEDVMFFVTIAAQEKTDQERANEVFVIVTAFPVKEIWTEADNGTLDFLTSGQDADGVSHDVVWASSHPDVISVDGVITQPGEDEENVVVTMTATITINSVEYSTSKTFTVAKKAGAQEVSTFAEAVALGKDAYVRVLGVTYLNRVSNGYYFTDGVDIIFVYVSSLPVEPGDVVDLTGIVAEYYGYAQFAGSDDKPILATPSDAEAKEPLVTEATIEWIMANRTATTGDMKLHAMYTVTGRVYHASSYTDPVYLVPSDYDFVNNFSADAKPIGAAIEIYDYSNDTLLIPFHGKEVTINILPLGFHSGHSNHHANFIGGTTDIIVSIDDDAEAVQTALDALNYPGTIVEDTTLEFPAMLYGVTLEYVSDNAAINISTGFVDAASQTEQVTVTITVTATRGDITDTKNIVIKVGELPVSTIAAVLAASNNTLLKVQGTVIAGAYYRTFFIQDATGNVAVYIPNNAAMIQFLADNLGNVIEVVGTRGAYNGLNQIIVATIDDMMFVEAGTLPTPTNLDDMEISSDNFLSYQGQLIELTGMKVAAKSADSYGNVNMTLTNLRNGTSVAVRWDSRTALPTELADTLAAIAVDDIINITSVLAWFNGPQIYITTTTVFAMTTDAEKLAADVSTLPATLETTSGAVEMALLIGPYGSTIVWDGTEITAAGGTYDPLTGEVVYPTVLVDTVFNVTATVSLGTETPVDVTLAITVLAMTDAEKVAAAIADTSIDEVADGYQVVMLPLTGLYGTTISWTIVSGDATLDVDGTTLTYNQAAAVADVVLEATFVNGLESQVVQYTVTVTPVTIITDLSTIPAMANTTPIYVQGVVTGIAYDGAFIQDANGVGFFLYRPVDKANLTIGDEVVYYGTVGENYGAKQLAEAGLFMELLSQGNALIYNTVTADQIDAFALADASSLFTFNRFTYQGVSGSTMTLGYTKTDLTTGTVTIRFYTNWTDLQLIANNYTIGDTLPEVQFILYNFRDGLKQLDVVHATFTDTEYIQWDANELPDSLELAADYIIPSSVYGSTYAVIAVSTELVGFINETTTPGTLLVTRPLEGQPNAVGTITIEVSLGTETPIDVVLNVTVYAIGTIVEQSVYSTGFESAEGFTAATAYNNTTVAYKGPVDNQWGTYYGTPSTTAPLIGSQSMQMRWYTSATANLGYTFTNFDTVDVTKITFFAANTLGLNVEVSISTDGGTTWIEGQTFTLTGNSTEYTYNVPVANQTGNIRVKFAIVLPDPIPTGTSRLYIDGVNFYGMRTI